MVKRIKGKGTAAEHMTCAALILNGYEVFLNTQPNGHSDLIAEKSSGFVRVQVKSFFKKQGNLVADARISSRGSNRHGSYVGLVDMMAFVDTSTGEVFLTEVLAQKTQVFKTSVSSARIFPLPL